MQDTGWYTIQMLTFLKYTESCCMLFNDNIFSIVKQESKRDKFFK
jgi:hypothetical protein